jgi:hypothetical protein
VLLIAGPRDADKVLADAFAHSAAKFGVDIVDRKPFKLGNDPRERDENNVTLLTATSADYDAVFVADTDGEFARGVPYRTTRPRPVVGSIGLVADAWDWTWDRYGAPQLIGRFLAQTGRHMTGLDWAVWVAAKMVVQVTLLTHGGDFAHLTAAIFGDTPFDGVKGLAVSVWPWDHSCAKRSCYRHLIPWPPQRPCPVFCTRPTNSTRWAMTGLIHPAVSTSPGPRNDPECGRAHPPTVIEANPHQVPVRRRYKNTTLSKLARFMCKAVAGVRVGRSGIGATSPSADGPANDRIPPSTSHWEPSRLRPSERTLSYTTYCLRNYL